MFKERFANWGMHNLIIYLSIYLTALFIYLNLFYLIISRKTNKRLGGSLPIAIQQVVSGTNTASARQQEKIDVMTMHALKREKEEVFPSSTPHL